MSSIDDAWSGLVSAVRLGRGTRVRASSRAPEQLLTLYEFEACPYCRKVREALSELDLEYICRPVARGSNNRRDTPSYRGRKYYPYLVDPNTGVSMKESEDIIDYLYRTYGERARPGHQRPVARLDTFGSFIASAMRPRGRVAREGARERSQPSQLLVLYQFEGCPYCRKVREKLQELNLDHHVKNAAKGSPRRAELLAIGHKVRVPYLVDPNTGQALYESQKICDYLEATYG
jgi:glutathione S-transferase